MTTVALLTVVWYNIYINRCRGGARMQEKPKVDDLLQYEAQPDDKQQRQIDDMRKKYVGNGMAIGMCIGVAGGMIFILKHGLVAIIIGALIGAVLGMRTGLEIFKRRH
jgi:predicted lipid-binding transport protein (Tim44 family)